MEEEQKSNIISSIHVSASVLFQPYDKYVNTAASARIYLSINKLDQSRICQWACPLTSFIGNAPARIQLFWSNLSHEICDQDICTKCLCPPLVSYLVESSVSRLVSFVRTLTSGSQFLLMAHWPSNYRHLRAKPSDDCTRLSCSSSLCTLYSFTVSSLSASASATAPCAHLSERSRRAI